MKKKPTTKEVVDACRAYHAGKGRSPSIALSINTGYSEKAVLRKMQQLVDKGILEMGFCIRTAWPAGEQTYEPTISNQPKPKKKERIF